MAAIIVKEVNRMAGYTPSGTIIAGQAVMLSDATTVIAHTGVGAVLGIALESTGSFTLSSVPTFQILDSRGLVDPIARPISDRPTGDVNSAGLFYDVNRGTAVTVALNGCELNVYNDGVGTPFEAAASVGTAYTIGCPIYSDQTSGILTSDLNTDNVQVGMCTHIPVLATANWLGVKVTV